ncbi:MAG: CHAD domain-containing protein [Actinomycetota bacterium]|nr:CHAD domain-containing protein [Actinomycetota bacterium]
MTETLLSFRAPGPLEAASAVERLAQASGKAPLEIFAGPHREERILYDTLDWSLYAKGWQLQGALVDNGPLHLMLSNSRGTSFSGSAQGAGACLATEAIEPIGLAERISALAGPRALFSLARADLVVATLGHRDSHGRVDARLELAHSPQALETWLRIHSDSGDPKLARELSRAAKSCIRHLWEVDPSLDYFDTPLSLSRRSRGDFSTKAAVAPREGEPLAATLAAFLGATWLNFNRAWEATQLKCDDESLHDLRVILRSTRAVLEPVAREKGSGILRELLAEIRSTAQATNEARDADVVVAELKRRFPDTGLAAHLDEVGAGIHDRVETAIATGFPALERLWQGTTAHLLATAHGALYAATPQRRALTQESLTFLRRAGRVQREYCRELVGELSTLPDPTHEQLHELRKQFKRLRYILESFDIERSRSELRDIADSKTLQTQLGSFQDAEVMLQFVNSFLDAKRDEVGEALANRLLSSAVAAREEAKQRSLAVLGDLARRPGWRRRKGRGGPAPGGDQERR